MNSKQIAGAAWWNAEDRIARLVALREQGKPFSEIARIMGTTKNTVLGKANRLGLLDTAGSVAVLNNPATPHESPDRSSCAWPLWGNEARPVYTYCRSPVAVFGASYCPDHMVVAHQRKSVV